MTTRQQIATSLFVARGYDPTGAASWVGSASQESGVNLRSGYVEKTDHGSQGIGQWRLDRLDGPDGLADFCRRNNFHSGTLAAQVEFAIWELGKFYTDLDKALRAGGDIDRLTARVCWEYERPAKSAANLPNRIKQAHICFNEYVAANSAHTQPAKAQATIAAAKKTSETHDAHAGIGVLAAGLIGFFHASLEIPAPILAALGGILSFAILYSIYQSEKAKTVAETTSVKPSPTAAAVEPGLTPTATPEWIFVPTLGEHGLWVRGAHPLPPPAPVAETIHTLQIAPSDMDALAEKIVARMLAPAAHK